MIDVEIEKDMSDMTLDTVPIIYNIFSIFPPFIKG